MDVSFAKKKAQVIFANFVLLVCNFCFIYLTVSMLTMKVDCSNHQV